MNKELPKAIAEASFKVFGVTLRCYVLDDGHRIINADDVDALLEAMSQEGPKEEGEIMEFAIWQRGVE